MGENREAGWCAACLAAVWLVGACLFAWRWGLETAGIFCLFGGAMGLIAWGFTCRRYKKIRELIQYLKRIESGIYQLEPEDYKEGELSALKSEIYKVTLKLSSQAQQLSSEKRYLADSLSDISHQLKTPLTSMMVMAELLGEENLPDEKKREFLETLSSQLRRIEWLVTSLLKMSKLDAGYIQLKQDEIVVESLIRRASEHLLIPMELKEQQLILTGDQKCRIRGDEDWLLEAFANILKNCMEYTKVGGTIQVHARETTLYNEIRISDEGPGIAKEDLPHIFQRFYRGKHAGKDSLGIGLYMAKNIIQKSGGTIDAASQPGEGSVFTVRFYRGVV